MRRLVLFAAMACVVGVCGLPVSAFAQDLPIGKPVHVSNLDGSRLGGTLISLDDKTVVIEQRKGTVNIPLAGVRNVTRDSYALAAGISAGLGAGVFSGLMLCAEASDCALGPAVLMTGGIGAGIGAGVGLLIKALGSNARVVYRAPARTSMTMAPVVGRRQVGVRGVIAW